MPKKKVVIKIQKKSDFEKNVENVDNAIEGLEDEIDKDVKIVEAWMIQRRKFFIKLGLVAILVIILGLILYLLSW